MKQFTLIFNSNKLTCLIIRKFSSSIYFVNIWRKILLARPNCALRTFLGTVLIPIPRSESVAATDVSTSTASKVLIWNKKTKIFLSHCNNNYDRKCIIFTSAAKYSVDVSVPPFCLMTSVTADKTANISLCINDLDWKWLKNLLKIIIVNTRS